MKHVFLESGNNLISLNTIDEYNIDFDIYDDEGNKVSLSKIDGMENIHISYMLKASNCNIKNDIFDLNGIVAIDKVPNNFFQWFNGIDLINLIYETYFDIINRNMEKNNFYTRLYSYEINDELNIAIGSIFSEEGFKEHIEINGWKKENLDDMFESMDSNNVK